MAGGTLAALYVGRNDPGFMHNGPLAGLVAICAGSDVMHPVGALVTGAVAGTLFVFLFTLTQNRWRIDDVLGVWPLHGLCGAWGGLGGRHLRRAIARRARRRELRVAAHRHRAWHRGGRGRRLGRVWRPEGPVGIRLDPGSRSSMAPTFRSTRSARRPSASRAGRRTLGAAPGAGILLRLVEARYCCCSIWNRAPPSAWCTALVGCSASQKT